MEVEAVRDYLHRGGHAFFMIDPFVRTGLDPVLREYGVVLDEDIVIDEASHFWADISAPAVSDYNRHQITRDLPLTFFPGARSLSPTRERVPAPSVVPLVNTSRNELGPASQDRVGFVQGRDTPGRHAHGGGAAAGRGGRDAALADRRRGRLGLRDELVLPHHGQRRRCSLTR
jgi:hypothetical protein